MDEAFDWLKRAYQERDVQMTGLLMDSSFNKLYNDPRWKDLLERVGLPIAQ